MRSAFLVLIAVAISHSVLGQSTPSDSRTLKLLLTEVKGLRHDLRASTAMSQRAQIALYRLQRQDEAVARATQRLGNARSRLANAMSDKSQKAEQTRSAKAAVSHSDAPNAQRHFEEVVLPELKVQLELMERDEQQARIDETEAEQHLRDEQTKLDTLNDTLDRLNTALEDARKR